MTSYRIDYVWPDSHRAEPGDLLLGPNIVHRVTAVRPVESRQWHDRWRLTVEQVGRRDGALLDNLPAWKAESIELYGACVVMETGRYLPGETAEEYARRHGAPLELEPDA